MGARLATNSLAQKYTRIGCAEIALTLWYRKDLAHKFDIALISRSGVLWAMSCDASFLDIQEARPVHIVVFAS